MPSQNSRIQTKVSIEASPRGHPQPDLALVQPSSPSSCRDPSRQPALRHSHSSWQSAQLAQFHNTVSPQHRGAAAAEASNSSSSNTGHSAQREGSKELICKQLYVTIQKVQRSSFCYKNITLHKTMYYKKNLFGNAGKHNKYLYTGCPFHTGNVKSVSLRNHCKHEYGACKQSARSWFVI